VSGESGAARNSLMASRFRSAFLAVLTVTAILLGLVGMHEPSHPTTGSIGHSPASVVATVPVSAGAVLAPGCVGECAMNCLLLGMVCALGLLVALIGLLLTRVPSPPMSGLRDVMRVIRIGQSKFALPTTPSLQALSISRT